MLVILLLMGLVLGISMLLATSRNERSSFFGGWIAIIMIVILFWLLLVWAFIELTMS